MNLRIVALIAGLFALAAANLHAGNLKVTLQPSTAVSAGAQWRVDGGSWKNSGTTVKNLSNTTHQVTFKSISGWITPPAQNVTLTAGNTTSLTATYVRPAAVTVNLLPTSGQWRIDGGAWRASGTSATGLTPGTHQLEYSALAGYETPATENISLPAGQTTTVARAYTALASFSVTLTPGNAQWRLDGGAWQASGATLADLALGTHTIDYSPVSGYVTPSSESVTLASGANPPLARTYAVAPGSVTVTLAPTSGQWRIDGGAWNASGATVSNLAAGSHTLEYATLAQYDGPPTETITLAGGEAHSLSRSYTRHAQILIGLVPASGQWRANGGVWLASGTSLWVPPGSYTIEYSPVAGYTAPANETLTLTAAGVFATTRYYEQDVGSIRVTLTPGTAQWRLDGGAWQSSGTELNNVPVGPHAIDYSTVSGYEPLAGESITLAKNESQALNRTYTALASFSVVLTPGSAQWKLDDGAWNASGASLADLPLGTHTIHYAPASGYLTPASETVTLVSGANPVLSRTYSPEPASLTVTLSPATAQWRVDAGTWNASDATVQNLTPGEHTIEFAWLSGYAAPASQTVTLANGEHRALSASYTPVGTINVVFDPSWASGQWRLDGGEWRPSGASLSNVTAGVPHTIEYAEAGGFVAPAPETFTLTTGEYRTITGTYRQLASVYVLSDPSWTQAQWRIDGGEWRPMSSSLYNLAFDVPHTIEFSEAPGFVAPAAQTITLASGENRTVTATYTPLASVYVMVDPSWAQGQWRIDGGEWRAMNSSLYNVSYGVPHTIDFSAAPGFVAPAAQTITLSPGESRTVTATYRQLASVYVMSDPSWVGGQWRIDGGEWRTMNSSVYNLSFDVPHTIEFGDVANFITPAAQTITLSSGESRTVTGTYTQLASLSVSLDLPAAKWRVDGGQWTSAGYSIYGLSIGTHTIEYSQHDGYVSPATETITLNSGSNWLTRTYATDPAFVYDYNLAGLTVNLDPSFAEWRIDGGRWNTSGATRFNLVPGTHTIEYAPLADYISPATETITLAAGTAQTLHVRYTSIDPAQLTVITNPASGQWRVYPYQWPASGTWHASGATATGLNPGPYTIEYSSVTGYDAPYTNYVNLLPNDAQSVTGNYQPRMFSYKVVLNPSNARYRLNGGAWLSSGSTTMGHQPGSYLIEFEPVAGYATPAPVTVTFAAGATETLTFTYTPL